MAISLENLIDLSLLTYYDENIKKWTVDRITKVTNDTIFTAKNELPTEGKKGVLYITEDSILIWDGTKYVDIGSGSQAPSSSTTWGTF